MAHRVEQVDMEVAAKMEVDVMEAAVEFLVAAVEILVGTRAVKVVGEGFVFVLCT